MFYEIKMVDAFVGGERKKQQWYKKIFRTFSKDDSNNLVVCWSWWAFFGGPFFLLYRKAYMPALVLMGIWILFWFVPFGLGTISLRVLNGCYGTYMVYQTYRNKKIEIELSIKDKNKRIKKMKSSAGCNSWSIIAGILFNIISAIVFISLTSLELINYSLE